jgi:hydrogenase maturation protease
VAEAPLLIGLGAPDRGDDAAGLIVAARLRFRLEGRARVVEGCADALALVALLEDAPRVVVVDALRLPDAAAGTISEFDLTRPPPPAAPARVSGHGDALGGAWQLVTALRSAPDVFRLVGVVGRDFRLGAPLSWPVRGALDRLAEAAVAALDLEPGRRRGT